IGLISSRTSNIPSLRSCSNDSFWTADRSERGKASAVFPSHSLVIKKRTKAHKEDALRAYREKYSLNLVNLTSTPSNVKSNFLFQTGPVRVVFLRIFRVANLTVFTVEVVPVGGGAVVVHYR